MKKFTLALVSLSALSIAACANEADEAAVENDDVLVDESYDDSAATLDEVTAEEPVVDEAAPPPAPPTVDEIDESDVQGTEAETEDVVGL